METTWRELRSHLLMIAGLIAVLATLSVRPVSATPSPEDGLDSQLLVTMDVDVVFIGFRELAYYGHEDEPHDFTAIYSDAIREEFLPRTNEPVLREVYDANWRPVKAHQRLTYRPRTIFADEGFENALFDHLRRIGTETPPTGFQDRYNSQPDRAVAIDEPVLRIPGPMVESWLARNLPRLAGTRPGADTIVFINWFGRPDFRFHVYQGDAVDPDTGRDDRRADTAGVAWGGTKERLWFYDLSAGPDYYNWNIVDEEFYRPFDDIPDFRIPPVWEMGADAAPWLVPDATFAVGVLARHSLFGHFGHSPLYDPLATIPAPGRERILRLNLIRQDPTDPATYLRPEFVVDGMAELQPDIATTWSSTEHPFDGDDALTFRIFTRAFDPLPVEPGCWQDFGHPYAQLHCHVEEHRERLAPAGDPGDVVIPHTIYAVDDVERRHQGEHAPLGVAYSITGTPHTVFAQTMPRFRAASRDVAPGIGMSHLLLHENGHFVGLSHPHDGWDSEQQLRWGPWAARFAFQLGECSCTMGYIATSGFGRFERDNQDRNLAARYYATTLRALEALPAGEAARAAADLQIAAKAFADRDWRRSLVAAARAYQRAVQHAAPNEMRRAAAIDGARHRNTPPPGGIDRLHADTNPNEPAAHAPTGIVLPSRGDGGYVDRVGR